MKDQQSSDGAMEHHVGSEPRLSRRMNSRLRSQGDQVPPVTRIAEIVRFLEENLQQLEEYEVSVQKSLVETLIKQRDWADELQDADLAYEGLMLELKESPPPHTEVQLNHWRSRARRLDAIRFDIRVQMSEVANEATKLRAEYTNLRQRTSLLIDQARALVNLLEGDNTQLSLRDRITKLVWKYEFGQTKNPRTHRLSGSASSSDIPTSTVAQHARNDLFQLSSWLRHYLKTHDLPVDLPSKLGIPFMNALMEDQEELGADRLIGTLRALAEDRPDLAIYTAALIASDNRFRDNLRVLSAVSEILSAPRVQTGDGFKSAKDDLERRGRH